MIIVHDYSAKCLLAFLNCKVSEWLLSKITGNIGGSAKIGQKSNFLKLSILKLSEEEPHWFDSMIDNILHRKEQKEDTSQEEADLNNRIYKLYNLDIVEIAEIEGSE